MVKVKGMRRTTPMEVLIPGRAPAMIPQRPPRTMATMFAGMKDGGEGRQVMLEHESFPFEGSEEKST